jgi:response regulator RpfG family c-di-GMP phosphodiesterase
MELFFLRKIQIFISVTYPLITLFVTFSLLTVIRFRMEEKRMLRRTKEMVVAQNLTLIGITSLAATRDKETGMHIRRTATFVKILAQRLSLSPEFSSLLDDHTIEVMFKSAPMHDIGKVGVPDAVLLKPGKLTEDEFKEIQKHTEHGWLAIEEAEKVSGIDGDTSFLKVSKEIIRCHHEKWDGSGYNQGLKGEEIPLSARIMAVADVYDALTSRRVYKDSFDHTKARDIIVEGRGSHFDPRVVDAFLEELEQFKEIAIQMADE